MPQHLCHERRMQRTRQPCRQLNSEGIKSTALCYLTPVISGRCSIISAKCVCKVKDKALPKAWATVCGKRDVCDRAISGQYFCNTPVSDAILKNILVQKFDAFSLSSTADIHNVSLFLQRYSQPREKKAISMRTQTRRAVVKMKFPALFLNNGSKAI